ncbi:unnamed protein product, partial [Mesorhabditis spiculigera]
MALLVLALLILPSYAQDVINAFSSRYGYYGPACAVEVGQLFIHGVLSRNLTSKEADEFQKYQEGVQNFQKSSGNGQLADAPVIPEFCGRLDDAIELVLKDCIVRNSHVYIGETLLRPLNNKEKQRIATTINRRSSRVFVARQHYLRRHRTRRTRRSAQMPTENISDIIHRFLKINSSITARFLPVVGDPAFGNSLGGWDPMVRKAIEVPEASANIPYSVAPTSLPITPEHNTFAPHPSRPEKVQTVVPTRPTPSTEAPPTSASSF